MGEGLARLSRSTVCNRSPDPGPGLMFWGDGNADGIARRRMSPMNRRNVLLAAMVLAVTMAVGDARADQCSSREALPSCVDKNI